MADYRLECCGGFPGHRKGCYALEAERKYARERKEKGEREELLWKNFFDKMTEEEFFEYVTTAEDEIAKADKWVLRRRRAMEYATYQKLYRGDSRFLDRLRKWQKDYYAKRR